MNYGELIRDGQAKPWKYGPYRLVVTRRVTEEEQISLECYETTRERAIETYGMVMASMREAMIAHNEKVVMIHQQQITALQRQIEHRAEELQELELAIEMKKQELNGARDAG